MIHHTVRDFLIGALVGLIIFGSAAVLVVSFIM